MKKYLYLSSLLVGTLFLYPIHVHAEETTPRPNSSRNNPTIRQESKNGSEDREIENTDRSGANAEPEITPLNYRLAKEDAVRISVFREPELTTVSQVDDEGMIRMLLIGKIKVLGLTLDEVADLASEKLNQDYLVEPKVTASIMGYSRKQFVILGPVRMPGVYSLSGGKKTDLLQVLATAGGLSRIADERDILIQRKVDGKETLFHLDSRAMQEGEAELFNIESGDIITIRESIF
jgi:polysaccharide export outer membrane protein